jgi:hypothetical protein
MKSHPQSSSKNRRSLISLGIILTALGLTYGPIPGVKQSLIVVSGTELAAPLAEIKTQFEQQHPQIDLDLKFQGSQDIVNNYIDRKNDFTPTVLMPANGEILAEVGDRSSVEAEGEPFIGSPQPIAKTFLVGIAWPERGKVLFPDGRFQWRTLERAMQQRNWSTIGGRAEWGSFDFIMTNPVRSNSGQLTLYLWLRSKLGGITLTVNDLNKPEIQSLMALIEKSVYRPPRSSDILLQEFIARGVNDADVATTYESIALSRWAEAQKNQGNPYQIYYLDPTVETEITAAILRRNVSEGQARAAKEWVTFLRQPAQQEVFVRYGFRPVMSAVNLSAIAGSPWSQKIPGVQETPAVKVVKPPDAALRGEIQRLWQRVD